MKITNEEKRQNASLLYNLICDCKTEYELERASDTLDEYLVGGCIFKKDYKALSVELDDRLMTLIEEGLV